MITTLIGETKTPAKWYVSILYHCAAIAVKRLLSGI